MAKQHSNNNEGQLFGLDDMGYPVPGQVIKYYREQMKYIDRDGKEKHWTQADLAKRLNITELMVRFMETKNKGLDSIERRRVLADILKIPPALLGLVPLSEVVKALRGPEIPTVIHKATDNGDTVTLYKNVLTAYNKLYAKGASQGLINDIQIITSRIKEEIKHSSNKREKHNLFILLWEFTFLMNLFYTYDTHDWNKFYRNINTSLEISKEINDVNLYILSLNQSCNARILQQSANLARLEIDAAIRQSKKASDLIQAIIYAQAAKAYSLNTTDLGDITSARQFIEQSQNILKSASTSDERYIPVRVNIPMCLFTQFDGLKLLNKYAEATSILDEVESVSPGNNIRDLALLNLNRARCYIAQVHPEYDKALEMIESAFDVFQGAGSNHNIRELIKVYNQIAISPYGNSPNVVDLGMELKELRRKSR